MSISEFIKNLGDTPEKIASKLTELGYEGFKNDKYNNPICNAINGECNTWPGLKLQHRLDKWGFPNFPATYFLTYNDSQIMDPQITTAVKEFMKQFDNNEFPQLDESLPSPGFYKEIKRGE